MNRLMADREVSAQLGMAHLLLKHPLVKFISAMHSKPGQHPSSHIRIAAGILMMSGKIWEGMNSSSKINPFVAILQVRDHHLQEALATRQQGCRENIHHALLPCSYVLTLIRRIHEYRFPQCYSYVVIEADSFRNPWIWENINLLTQSCNEVYSHTLCWEQWLLRIRVFRVIHKMMNTQVKPDSWVRMSKSWVPTTKRDLIWVLTSTRHS